MKIYVGNLTVDTMESPLIHKFERFGRVLLAKIIKSGGKSQGYAIIEMPNEIETQSAIDGLDKLEFNGCWRSVKQPRF